MTQRNERLYFQLTGKRLYKKYPIEFDCKICEKKVFRSIQEIEKHMKSSHQTTGLEYFKLYVM